MWKKLEEFIGEEIPICVKETLDSCGYDTLFGLREIVEDHIPKIEQHMSENCAEKISQWNCYHSEYYKRCVPLKFLPGHTAIILSLPKYVKSLFDINRPTSIPRARLNFILEEMIQTAESNLLKSKHHTRYPDSIRFFATYIFLLCGRSCYEMLHLNLPIPSTKTILRCISENRVPIVEGQIRAKELSEYLGRLKSTKCVWISEDATAITSKVTYNASTNQLIGLVLPTNKETGCPKTFAYSAFDAETIKKHLMEKKSTVLYLVMAQPIDELLPPFVLQMYGSDNTFNSQDVIRRWNYTHSELSKYGVKVIGWSSDGDPRLLSAMNYQINQPTNDFDVIQDPTHIATKLRNRLLKPSIILPMGNKNISVNHLTMLIESVQKSVHGLCKSDVCPKDRQNFRSFQKIVDDRVIDALNMNIGDSGATVKYLKLCDDVTSCFLDYDLTPLDRIIRMFRAVYFFRIWRNYLKSSRYYNLSNNFITQNAYTCIEINARNMLRLITRFRNENSPHLFILPMFDSQTCEKAFRQLRSMGTVDFTRINFTMYDLQYMIGRIEVQNDIVYFKLNDGNVSFPLSHKRSKKTKIYDLPSENEIIEGLNQAKRIAVEDARSFGMDADGLDLDIHEFLSKLTVDNDEGEEEGEEGEGTINENFLISEDDIQEENIENTHYTNVIDENGDERIIRKSTLVWLLTEPGAAVSKDRLRRVQVTKKRKSNVE